MELLGVLSDETRRRQLKTCYSILSTDHNKPSLSLYSGPDPTRSHRRNHSIAFGTGHFVTKRVPERRRGDDNNTPSA